MTQEQYTARTEKIPTPDEGKACTNWNIASARSAESANSTRSRNIPIYIVQRAEPQDGWVNRREEENRKNSRPTIKLMKAYDFVRYAEKQILENKMSPDALCGEEKAKRKI